VTELGALEGREVAENNISCDHVAVIGSLKYHCSLQGLSLQIDYISLLTFHKHEYN
jgi:hypothetical protein